MKTAQREAFSGEYLTLTGGPDMVCEPPVDRYLPLKPRTVSERQVQLLWKNLLFKNNDMKTTKGHPVRIIKPGRFNHREGPDFKNALFLLDGQEVAGDVEIHINAREWYEHKHHRSRYYGNTVLHVFLQKGQNPAPAVNILGKELYEVELGLYLRHSMEELKLEVETGASPVSCRAQRPPCRDRLLDMNMDAINRLLNIVGEGRMLIKSNRFMDIMEVMPPGQALYASLLECLGYANFKKQFQLLAERLPLASFAPLAERNSGMDMVTVLQAAMFTVAGFLPAEGEGGEDAELKEKIEAYHRVKLGDIKPVLTPADWPLKGCRPQNHPARRIAAAGHIAAAFAGKAPERLFLFSGLHEDEPPKTAVRQSLEWLKLISDPFWDHRYNFYKKANGRKGLIGRDRAISLLVDAAIPLFLAMARTCHDLESEKKLLQVYYQVPKPASNAVVDFMCRNLFGKKRPGCVGNVRHQQALLQLYKDFCHGYPSSCGDCPLPDYLLRYH